MTILKKVQSFNDAVNLVLAVSLDYALVIQVNGKVIRMVH